MLDQESKRRTEMFFILIPCILLEHLALLNYKLFPFPFINTFFSPAFNVNKVASRLGYGHEVGAQRFLSHIYMQIHISL